MAKKLLLNEAAEREANDVALRFMNSDDVLKDMRAEYGSRLDGVQLHDDEEAQEHVKSVRRDAVARGRDVYFGRGILQSKSPEAKGLIAHELAHTMQQDGFGGMNETVSFGEEQGGLLDRIRGRFGKKKDTKDTGPKLIQKDRTNTRAAALNEMIKNATPEQLADPLMQKIVQDAFNEGMSRRMQGKDKKSAAWELRTNTDETTMMSSMLNRLMPEGFMEQLDTLGMAGMENIDADYITRVQKDDTRGVDYVEEMGDMTNEAGYDPEMVKLSGLRSQLYGNIEHMVDSSQVGSFLAGAKGMFNNTAFDDEEEQAGMLMSLLFNRAITPAITNKNMAEKDPEKKMKRAVLNQSLMRGAKVDYDDGLTQSKHRRFMGMLRKRF